MLILTDEFLKPEPGTITHWPADMGGPIAGTWSLEIPLQPWSAEDEFEPDTYRPDADGPERVQTSIMLEFIDLPADDLRHLSGRSVSFPPNPQPGFAEGSVYLLACHCPVGVSRIAFGAVADDRITADLSLFFDFVRAGGIDIRNRTAELHVLLRPTPPNELRAAFHQRSS